MRVKKTEASKVKNLSIKSGLFFISGVKKAFIKLKQVFVEALLLNYFDPEHYIQIKIDVLGYAIGGILSQLILDDLDQWHLVAFFSQKMIFAEIQYKTDNNKLLAIIKVFKT